MMSSSGRQGRDRGEEAVRPESQISFALCQLRVLCSPVTSSYYTEGVVFFFWFLILAQVTMSILRKEKCLLLTL